MSERGRLIVFEGGEGSGKSSQTQLLADHLGAELTREPGGTPLGEAIRSLCLDFQSQGPLDAHAELFLMVAARAQHVATRIAPVLASGGDVVCDRYSGSTIAYQGYGRGLPLDLVRSACAMAEDGISPELVILLDLPVQEGLSRLGGSPDRIESEDLAFHQRVAQGFRSQAAEDPSTWVVVDATGDLDVVAGRVRRVVTERLGDVGSSDTVTP